MIISWIQGGRYSIFDQGIFGTIEILASFVCEVCIQFLALQVFVVLFQFDQFNRSDLNFFRTVNVGGELGLHLVLFGRVFLQNIVHQIRKGDAHVPEEKGAFYASNAVKRHFSKIKEGHVKFAQPALVKGNERKPIIGPSDQIRKVQGKIDLFYFLAHAFTQRVLHMSVVLPLEGLLCLSKAENKSAQSPIVEQIVSEHKMHIVSFLSNQPLESEENFGLNEVKLRLFGQKRTRDGFLSNVEKVQQRHNDVGKLFFRSHRRREVQIRKPEQPRIVQKFIVRVRRRVLGSGRAEGILRNVLLRQRAQVRFSGFQLSVAFLLRFDRNVADLLEDLDDAEVEEGGEGFEEGRAHVEKLDEEVVHVEAGLHVYFRVDELVEGRVRVRFEVHGTNRQFLVSLFDGVHSRARIQKENGV